MNILSSLYNLRNEYLKDGIIFSFSGEVSQLILTSIVEELGNKMEMLNVKTSIIQNIFSIFIEQIQNIMKYSPNIKQESLFSNISISVIGFDNKKLKYYVSSGNIINKIDKEKVENKISKLNSMDKQELKDYYKELRKSGLHKHEKGAGLGLIEMARKASEPIEFAIDEIDELFSFFTIKTII